MQCVNIGPALLSCCTFQPYPSAGKYWGCIRPPKNHNSLFDFNTVTRACSRFNNTRQCSRQLWLQLLTVYITVNYVMQNYYWVWVDQLSTILQLMNCKDWVNYTPVASLVPTQLGNEANQLPTNGMVGTQQIRKWVAGSSLMYGISLVTRPWREFGFFSGRKKPSLWPWKGRTS